MDTDVLQKLLPDQMFGYAETTTRFALDELLKLARHVSTVSLSLILASNAFVASVYPDAGYRLLLILSTIVLLLSIIFATLLYYAVLQVIMRLAADSQISLNLQPVLDLVYKHGADKREANTKDAQRRLSIGLIGMTLSFLLGILFIAMFVFLNAIPVI